MKRKEIQIWLNYFIAAVWIGNGLFCKVLDLVPRHEAIVQRILNLSKPGLWTFLIGVAETGMAIWILIGVWSRLNAVVQIFIIAVMNILEFLLVPDLLLWGKANALFAFLFIVLIYFNEFHLSKKTNAEVSCYRS